MSAFDKIHEGLTEALAIAKGEAEPAAMHVPAEIDVRAIRRKLDLSQPEFAARFGFTVHQIRQWEQERHRPRGALRAFLMVIDRNPESVIGTLRQADYAA